MLKVLLFGRLADVAGWRERELAVPPTLLVLREILSREDAALGAALGAIGVQTALNQVLTRGDADLAGVSEVAFLPPMSGG